MRFVMSMQCVEPVGDNGVSRACLAVPCDCQLVGFVLSGASVVGYTSLFVNEENLCPELILDEGNNTKRVVDFDAFTGTGGEPLRMEKGDALHLIFYVGEDSKGVRADVVFIEG